MSRITLGIMTLYYNQQKKIEERNYFKKLIIAGRNLGIDVFVFTPEDVNAKKKQIHVHNYNQKWQRKWAPFPMLIFDRCRYQPTYRFKQLRQFRARYPKLNYLNRPLANKWVIQQLLSKSPEILPNLPATRKYRSTKGLIDYMQQEPMVYLKPINGTGGRGILRIEKTANHSYKVQGRDSFRKIIPSRKVNTAQLVSKLKSMNVNHSYIIQQGIQLKLKSGHVHDYRLLMQKNESGQWEVTGCVGRIGARRSITSNLHGGGKAVPMVTLMKQWFPNEDQIKSIQTNVYQLGEQVVKEVEKHYGTLCEMALDIAIDRSGHIWLLEINPKPSREVFAKAGEHSTYKKAVQRPMEYALWLLKQKS